MNCIADAPCSDEAYLDQLREETQVEGGGGVGGGAVGLQNEPSPAAPPSMALASMMGCGSDRDCPVGQLCNRPGSVTGGLFGRCGECLPDGMGCPPDQFCNLDELACESSGLAQQGGTINSGVGVGGCRSDRDCPIGQFCNRPGSAPGGEFGRCGFCLPNGMGCPVQQVCNLEELACESPNQTSVQQGTTMNDGTGLNGVDQISMYRNPDGNKFFCGVTYTMISQRCLRSKPCPSGIASAHCSDGEGCYFVPICATEYSETDAQQSAAAPSTQTTKQQTSISNPVASSPSDQPIFVPGKPTPTVMYNPPVPTSSNTQQAGKANYILSAPPVISTRNPTSMVMANPPAPESPYKLFQNDNKQPTPEPREGMVPSPTSQQSGAVKGTAVAPTERPTQPILAALLPDQNIASSASGEVNQSQQTEIAEKSPSSVPKGTIGKTTESSVAAIGGETDQNQATAGSQTQSSTETCSLCRDSKIVQSQRINLGGTDLTCGDTRWVLSSGGISEGSNLCIEFRTQYFDKCCTTMPAAEGAGQTISQSSSDAVVGGGANTDQNQAATATQPATETPCSLCGKLEVDRTSSVFLGGRDIPCVQVGAFFSSEGVREGSDVCLNLRGMYFGTCCITVPPNNGAGQAISQSSTTDAVAGGGADQNQATTTDGQATSQSSTTDAVVGVEANQNQATTAAQPVTIDKCCSSEEQAGNESRDQPISDDPQAPSGASPTPTISPTLRPTHEWGFHTWKSMGPLSPASRSFISFWPCSFSIAAWLYFLCSF